MDTFVRLSPQISMVKSFQSPMCFFLSEARTVTIQIPNTQILENIRIIDSCKNLITKNDTKDGFIIWKLTFQSWLTPKPCSTP